MGAGFFIYFLRCCIRPLHFNHLHNQWDMCLHLLMHHILRHEALFKDPMLMCSCDNCFMRTSYVWHSEGHCLFSTKGTHVVNFWVSVFPWCRPVLVNSMGEPTGVQGLTHTHTQKYPHPWQGSWVACGLQMVHYGLIPTVHYPWGVTSENLKAVLMW
jgi:hypothetical protein